MTPARLVLLLLCAASVARADELIGALHSAELGRRFEPELFARAVRSPDAHAREVAARVAGRLRDERAVGWLLEMLRDESGRVRRAALFALGQIGSAAVVLPVREALPTLAPNDLPHAIEALGKTKDPRATSTVVAYLAEGGPEVRNQAALALFRIGDASALTELFAALAGEQDPEPRWRCVYSCFRLLRDRARRDGSPVAVDAAWQKLLVESTDARRPFFERVFAAMALGATQGGGGKLEPLLDDEDPRVVVAALRGLALGPPEGRAEALVRRLDHRDALVRETVLDALLAWKAADALAAARARLTGRDAMRAQLAFLDAGGAAGAAPEWKPGDALGEEWICGFVAKAGGALPDPATLRTVAGLRAAAEACGSAKIAPERAQEVLRFLMGHADATVRATAAGAVAERGFGELAPALVEAARTATGNEAGDVGVEVAAALAKLGIANDWLRTQAASGAFPVRGAARDALEELGQPLPPERPRSGFRLHGHDAQGVHAAARALRGARVVLKTNRGTMTLILLPDEAPAHCVNFARLVEKGFYDGLSWHRVVADFVIQGGCPRGDGWGGPGYSLPDEIGTRPYVRGTVGMPKAGDDTGGCQLFITHLPTPHLDGRYSVFAQVIEGLGVIDAIRVGDRIESAELKKGDAGR